MIIKIIRGTNQIGGCITEISSSKGAKIIIDIGSNLPNLEGIDKPEIEIEGLTSGGEAKYDAVLITHYHGDHVGRYKSVLKGIPIYMGEISKGIFNILQERLSLVDAVIKEDLEIIKDFKTFKIQKKIIIKDIVITPIMVNHSAFDAYMFLIECDGKKTLHTGDFRIHGQRGKSVFKAIEKYVGNVDCLICEGTTLSRKNEEVITEFQLQKKVEEIFKNNKYNFVLCSSTNIDRIAALHKATLKTKKMFICDEFQKRILEYVNSVAISNIYKFNDNKETKVYYYYDNMLEKMEQYGFVMLIRPNRLSKKIMELFPDNTFIYSQWLGYLKGENKKYKRIQEIVPKEYIYLHTSGHATPDAIKYLIDLTSPKVVIPIHTEEKNRIRRLTNKAVILDDGQEFIVN